MEKKTKKYLLIIIVIVAVIAIAVGVTLFIILGKRNKVSSIKVPTEVVELEYDGEYEIEYEVFPKEAKNKDVRIKIKNDIVSKVDGEMVIKATENKYGNDTVCLISVENEDVESCFDVYVKRKPFSKQMEGLYYTNEGNGIYSRRGKEISYVLNIPERTFTTIMNSDGVKMTVVYHYRDGYSEIHTKTGGYKVEWIYREETKRASCAASSYYSTFCNSSSEAGAINTFTTQIQLCNSLIGDYTDEELST